MDGKWISMIVDHMTELLVSYAEEADFEAQQNLLVPGRQQQQAAIVT